MAKTKQKSPSSAKKPSLGDKAKKNKDRAVAKKKQSRKWSAFVLSDNTVHAIQGVKVAKLYEEDNIEMIKEKQTFVAKKEMTNWIAIKELQFKGTAPKPKPGTSPGDVPVKNFDVDDQAKIDAALREIDAKRPADKLEVHYRTSSFSRAIVCVLRFINLQGKDAWNLKPDSICLSISNWTMVFKQECPLIAYALAKLAHLRMRDPAGDMYTVAQKKWTSSVSKEERSFDTFIATTHFLLPPLEELTTPREETLYIEEKCKELGNAILYIIQQQTFAKCYEHAIKHDRIWRAVSRQTSKAPGNSHVDYVKGARVVILHCPNFNTHVAKDDAAELGELLRTYAYSHAKYPPTDAAMEDTDDDNEDEEEEEDSDDDTDPSTKKVTLIITTTPPSNKQKTDEPDNGIDKVNDNHADAILANVEQQNKTGDDAESKQKEPAKSDNEDSVNEDDDE